MNHRALSSVVIVSALVTATLAAGADPTKQQCIAADDAAQDLRQAGRLRAAREKLAVCVSMSCPGPVREDCAQRLNELDEVMPTIVFEAKDSAGNDLSAVTVTMDGQPFAGKLDGTAHQVDPGAHRFVFQPEGLPSTEKAVVVREGDKNRHELLVLGPAPTNAPLVVSPSQSGADGSTQRTIGLVLGGVGIAGVAAGAVFGLIASSGWRSSQNECSSPTNCPNHGQAVSDHDSALTASTFSTVGFVAGGALLAVGITLFVAAPSKRENPGVAHLQIAPQVGKERCGLMLKGRF